MEIKKCKEDKILNISKCAACVDFMNPSESMACSNCPLAFHHQCLRMNVTEYNNYTPTQKATWRCPNCCGTSKKGNNQNTPVRDTLAVAGGSADIDMQSPVSWVTQRTKNLDANQSMVLFQSGNEQHQCLTKDDIREVMQTELRNILSAEIGSILERSVSSYMQAIKSEIVGLKNELGAVKESMDFINDEFENIKKNASDSSKVCDGLRKEVETLKISNKELNRRLTQIEQHSRACNVEIQCLPEHRSENLVTVAMQLAKIVSCDIKEEDVHHCTRTAKLDASSSRPRAVILQMKSPIVRDRLLASVVRFNKAHHADKLNTSHLGIGGDKKAVYVSEHLSPYNRELHRAARIAAKEKRYKFVWVRSGRVFVRKDENTQAIVLKDLDSVNNL